MNKNYNDLIERYLYAVTKRMPAKQRDDVSQELRGLIDDMLTERCGDTTPTDKDLQLVLTELGTPQELYAKYDPDADKCLIGQPYYSTYKFVMKIVLAAVTVGILISSVILQIMEPQGIFEAIGTGIGMVYNSLLSAFAIVTLLFAFFYHKGVKLGETFNFDDLPPVPKKKQEISKWDSIFGIIISAVFMVVFLTVPQVFCCILQGEPVQMIPIFNVETVRAGWYFIVLFGLLGIGREIFKLMEGRYGNKVLVCTLVTNAASGVLSFLWLTNRDIMNPAFTSSVSQLFQGEEAFIIHMFENFQYFFLLVILLALVLDTVDTAVRTLKK